MDMMMTACRANTTALSAETINNIQKMMAHAEDVVLYDGADDEVCENDKTVALDGLEIVRHQFEEPMLDLHNGNHLVLVLACDRKQKIEPSATMGGPDGPLYLYLMAEPTKLPDDYLAGIPLPVETHWANEARTFRLVDGELVLVEGSEGDLSEEDLLVDARHGADEPATLNNAKIIGTQTDAFNEVLNREVEVLVGSMYGARDKRNTQDGQWTALKAPLLDLIKGYDAAGDAPEFGFSRHTPSKNKAGPCIVLGSSIDGARKANAMKTMHFLGIDIDSGAKLDNVIETIKRRKLFCLVHTSYNHGKSGLHLKRDEVLRKLGIKESPTLEQVKDYLRQHDKNRYEESFIQAVTIKADKEQVKDGVVIVLDTPPLDKMRLIFPLAAPVEIVELAETHQEALDVWEDSVTGLAHKELGVHFDTSCTDPSRLFYTPRHPKGSDDWQSYIIMGDPLRFEDIPRVKKSQYTKNRDLNAFVQADDTDGPQKVKTIFLPSGAILNDWHSKVGKSRFQLAELLETFCQDKIRIAGGERSGHVHTECPFEHEHTSEGGTATMAINALDSRDGYWTWFCHHDACQSRHKTELLGEAIELGWFDEALLMDDEFLMPPEDDQYDYAEEMREDASPEGPPSVENLINRIDFDGDEAEASIRKLYERLHNRGIDKVAQKKVSKIIKEKSGLDLTTLKGFWRDLDRDAHEAKQAKERKNAAGEEVKPCYVDKEDFSRQKTYAVDLIHAQNDRNDDPMVFVNGNILARVQHDRKKGGAEIVDLSKDALVTFLTDYGMFVKSLGEGKPRQVECPDKIAVQIIHEWEKTQYPELEGIIPAPQFSEKGALVSKPGYHEESGLYYAPPIGFEIAEVPDQPNKADVESAVARWRDLFADFPFLDMTRQTLMRGDESADFAHLIGLALTTPARDLMGATAIVPAFLASKPTPGTGATLMLQIVQIILFGGTSISPPSTNDDDLHKEVFADLIAGKPMKVWDNVETVGGSVYPALLTASEYSGRVLGLSLTKTVKNRMSVGFTGNNVQFSKELRRRVVLCRLDAKMESPEDRNPESFAKPNVLSHVSEN